jgi:riboflavin kinase/FMN adenylyltransferase
MAVAGRGAGVVVTFEDPAEDFSGPEGPRLLNYGAERVARLDAAGIDAALVLPFDDNLRRTAADRFVEEILVGTLHVRGVCVGYDHHFGADGSGDISLLSLLGKKYGFESRAAPPFAVDGMIVSSTLIRRRLREGNVAEANKYLGYRYEVWGEVERGSGIAAGELGYPTANIALDAKMLPATGVYAALGDILDDKGNVAEGPFGAFLNLGYRPTFNGDATGDPRLEVHLFDFGRDILGRRIRVQFVARLRDEEKFEDAAALRKQLEEDEKKARRILFRQ